MICARGHMTTTVTLGGFLTISRCDLCKWFQVIK